MDWLLYNRDLRDERVKSLVKNVKSEETLL